MHIDGTEGEYRGERHNPRDKDGPYGLAPQQQVEHNEDEPHQQHGGKRHGSERGKDADGGVYRPAIGREYRGHGQPYIEAHDHGPDSGHARPGEESMYGMN